MTRVAGVKAKLVARLAGLGALAALVSCGADPVAPTATVYYAIDAPLCSSRIPVVFAIDSVQVGTDTFVVHLTPEHTRSRGFGTSVGRHTVSARVAGGLVWPDRVVTLGAGEVFTDSLPFYCS
jgi:hypothetical protein